MMVVLQYVKSDGRIHGVWRSSSLPFLQAQIHADDAVYGYLAEDTLESPELIQSRFRIADGARVPKLEVTLTATPNPFPADGTSVCTMTVMPFVPCVLTMQQEAFPLTEADPTLTLTSDEARQFEVRLQPQATAWAPPLLVEAQ